MIEHLRRFPVRVRTVNLMSQKYDICLGKQYCVYVGDDDCICVHVGGMERIL